MPADNLPGKKYQPVRLPLRCEVDYLQQFLSKEEASALHQELIEVYRIDRARLVIEAGGKMISTDCFKMLFSTADLIANDTHPESVHGMVIEWSGLMADLRQRVEACLDAKFELALCNYYPDGSYHLDFHFDQMTSGTQTIIPSISLGEVRRFEFRDVENGEVYALDLDDGSLLVMGEHCQNRYEHSLPKDPACRNERINITFRERGFQ